MASSTLYEYYTSRGKSLPSIQDRGKLFESYGLGPASSYGGTAEQNSLLLRSLQSGGASPQSTPQPQTSTPKMSSPDQANSYLNTFQNNMFSGNTALPSESQLIAAMKSKGHTEETARAAIAGRGIADLAREYLGYTSSSSTAGFGVNVPTFDEVKTQLTPSTPRPELIDRTALREGLRLEYGLTDLETRLNDLNKMQMDLEAVGRKRLTNEEGKPIALGVIGGRQTEIERQTNEDLDLLSRQKQVIVNELNTKYAIVETIMKDKTLDYNDAVERYNNEFESNLGIMNMVRGLQQDALDVARFNQSVAATNLQMYVNAAIKGNIDYNSLDPSQQAFIAKLEVQSGLPVGFISSIKKDPNADIIFTTSNEGVTQVGFRDADGGIRVESYGTRISSGTESDRKRGAFSEMGTWLREKGGDDNFVSPEEWNFAKQQWLEGGYEAEDFDNAFRATFVGDPESRGFSSASFNISQ